MNKPDFHGWEIGLTDDQISQALAAAGVLCHHCGSYPFAKEDEEWMLDRLREAHTESDGTLIWEDPGFTTVFERHTSQIMLANAWQRFTADGKDFKLEIRGAPLEYCVWYFAQLRRTVVRASSVYLYHPPQSFPLDWDWPIRIAFARDELTEKAEGNLKALLAGQRSWMEHIVRLVDASSSSTAVDLLLFAHGAHGIETLMNAPAPIRAHCCVLLGLSDGQLDELLSAVETLSRLTLASGAIVSCFDPLAPQGWLVPLVRELSHNHSLSESLQTAVAEGRRQPGEAVLMGSPDLLRAAMISEFGIGLADRLSNFGPQSIEIDQGMGGHLGLAGGVHPSKLLGKRLQGSVHTFNYMAEIAEATTISKLSSAAASLAMVQPAPSPAFRFLQHRLQRGGLTVPAPSEKVFYADEDYTLHLRIGLKERGWERADRAFLEEELPKNPGGHLLTVVFSEPEVIPIPMLSSLFLPAVGSSSSCKFSFRIGAEVKTFRGRVVIVFENRILQTALLEGRVFPYGSSLQKGATRQGVRFTIESIVLPQLSPLDSRKRYSAAILTNQSRKAGKQALCIRGYRAALIHLKDVASALESIKRTLDDCEWERMEKCTLDSDEVLCLLRSLAVHGRHLYDALVTDQHLSKPLQDADRVQLIAANAEAAHLPIEFCYSREPPGTKAKLCPRLQSALAQGAARSFRWEDCKDGCIAEEDESSVICPWAFWALNRVIEWHRFDSANRQTMNGADYALQSERTTKRPDLSPLRQILLAASKKVRPTVEEIGAAIGKDTRAPIAIAGTWAKWVETVGELHPTLMVLMVHTEKVGNAPSMEINGELLDPPYIGNAIVGDQENESPPIVLLLGCGTGVADVGFYKFPAQFRRKGAAIVVSTVAELLDVHAPRLAELIVEELASPKKDSRTFGEVMLAMKRRSMIDGQPIAMALVSYGDADWEV